MKRRCESGNNELLAGTQGQDELRWRPTLPLFGGARLRRRLHNAQSWAKRQELGSNELKMLNALMLRWHLTNGSFDCWQSVRRRVDLQPSIARWRT